MSTTESCRLSSALLVMSGRAQITLIHSADSVGIYSCHLKNGGAKGDGEMSCANTVLSVRRKQHVNKLTLGTFKLKSESFCCTLKPYLL